MVVPYLEFSEREYADALMLEAPTSKKANNKPKTTLVMNLVLLDIVFLPGDLHLEVLIKWLQACSCTT